jgi:hypothetical protein
MLVAMAIEYFQQRDAHVSGEAPKSKMLQRGAKMFITAVVELMNFRNMLTNGSPFARSYFIESAGAPYSQDGSRCSRAPNCRID